MLAGDLILRWVHIMGAVMLVGSIIYLRTVYVAAAEVSNEPPGPAFSEHARRYAARLVMIASAWLLISGIFSFVAITKRYDIDKSAFPGSIYHMVFGIKFLLAFVTFFLAAAITGRRGLAQKLRQREKLWLTVIMVLGGLIIFLAGVLRLAKRTEKPAASERPTQPIVRLADYPSSSLTAPRIS